MTPPARNHANQSDRNATNGTRPENGNRLARQKEENSRMTTYRDILNRRSRPNSRNSSFTNLRRRSNTGITDSKQRSNTNLSRRGSYHDHDQQKQTAEETENAMLRKRLAKYEREAAEAPKNATPPSEEGESTSTKATNQEILDYLTTTMRNLERFRRQLLN